MRSLAIAALLVVSTPALAEESDEASAARAVVERGIAAHGGEVWRSPESLILSGEAVFFAPDSTEPRSRSDDYRMWREYDGERSVAHGAEGKVRIRALIGENIMFEVGYDGATTWNQNGIVPKAEADTFWANNFGFGIIRSALNEGFLIESVPDREVGGHAVAMVRILDPQGSATLFGFDKESGFIRYLGFDSPRGWHERVYDDFIRLPDSGWVQAREVTLSYDGVMNNRVFWRDIRVGEAIDPSVFAPPEP